MKGPGAPAPGLKTMKYAVINLNDNSWQFESNSLADAEVAYFDLKLTGTPVVLVMLVRDETGEVVTA